MAARARAAVAVGGAKHAATTSSGFYVAAPLDRPRQVTIAVEGLDHVLAPKGLDGLVHIELSCIVQWGGGGKCVCVVGEGGLMVMPMGGVQTYNKAASWG